MSGKTRWQDWITAALGVILVLSPFVFGDTSQTAAALTAYIGGLLLFIFGAASLLFRVNKTVEYLPLIEGVLIFLAPWVLGFSGVTAMAWSAWVIGILAFINAGSVFVDRAGMMGRRAQSN